MYKCIKRSMDVILSVIALVLLSPLLVLTAVLIIMESKGPIIFKQERLGRHGHTFIMYKFRSMCNGAENKGTGQYSFKDDPRVTKVGKIIRLLSIDELPQLVNVIKGDMSLIGPRPVLTYHPWKYDEYTDRQKKRFSVRPGLTGLAQINGRKNVDWNTRLENDVYYSEHLSFALDFSIFVKTIVKLVCGSDNENTSETAVGNEGKDVIANVKFNVHNKQI